MSNPKPPIFGTWKLHRTPSSKWAKLVRAHAQRTGQVVWHWNGLQDQLLNVFASLIDTPYDVSRALWFTIHSDRTQREMVKHAAGTLDDKNPLKAEIFWLVTQVGKLSDFRNDIAHTPMVFRPVKGGVGWELAPNFTSKPGAVDRLTKNPPERVWRTVRGDLYVLTQYAAAIWAELNWPGEHGPLPRRPRLRSVPENGGTTRPKAHPQGRAKPTRPQKSSLA